MVRKILRDFSGQEWYVESEDPIAVDPCPKCGRPIKVQAVKITPSVTTVIFRNTEGKTLGIFDTREFPRENAHCHFCGYTEK